MSMSIQTNVNALMAQENLRTNNEFQGKTIQRLTSGYRINSSGDDAAGLAVANKFRSDTAELVQGVRNANDGISTLQIIDGGANNISKILDRMKTLATQSASTAFTGNRTTLDTEFQALKLEIDRQAANVNLNTNGTSNSLMSVYIGGGGVNQSNAKVTVDLSGSGNAIDAAGLGVSGTNLLAGGTVFGGSAPDLSVSTSTFLTGNAAQTTQVFTFNLGDAGSVLKATISGGATGAGITGANAVSQLNAAINASGLTASIGTGGALTFSSANAFTVSTAAALVGGGGAAAGAVGQLNTAIENQGMYRLTSGRVWVPTTGPGADAEVLTFTKGGVSKAVTLDANAPTADAAIGVINAALKAAGIGITALQGTTANQITFQSAGDFTLAVANGANNLGGWAASGNPATSAPVVGSSATANALSAITALSGAVTNLGSVQGKIGAGQNKLAYAINLAQSQISGFSAAESRIRDTDVASEAANLTKAQVLVQASMAAMAQANSAPQAVLSLLRG